MTSWAPELKEGRGPIYRAIAEALARDLDAGRIAPGFRLPPQRDLARALGVNLSTVTRAYNEAARRGLVEGTVGRGTFVRRPYSREGFARGTDSAIDLAFNVPCGVPDSKELAAALEELAHAPDGDQLLVGYQLLGRPEHRELGARYLARSGIEAGPERVIVTGGAQHAMAVVFSTMCRAGDTVLCESLTYPGMKGLATTLGLRLSPVEMDSQGLMPEALEAACRSGSARVLYTMPTLHNPTGVVMPLARRERIAEIAREHQLLIVEDDTYGFLLEDAPPTFASLLPELTFYTTSPSKSLGAGLRIGFLLAPASPAAITDRLARTCSTLGWTAAPPMVELTGNLIAAGVLDRLVAWKRHECRERCILARQALGDPCSPSSPVSPHLWIELPEPWRGDSFAARARERGVALTSAEVFAVGTAPAPRAARLCIGTPPERAQLSHALEIVRGVLGEAPEESWSVV